MAKKPKDAAQAEVKEDAAEKTLFCGIVMPISDTPSYRPGHWNDVFRVIKEAVNDVGFDCDLVSNANETSLIHGRIVNNLYESDMVVVDVSSKNANVMFELGMRLTFDKPVVVIKDERTDYAFDINVIEHLPYVSDLRFQKIVDFKSALGEKVKATYEASKQSGYKSFLKHFQILDVPELEQKTGTANQLILQRLDVLSNQVNSLVRPRRYSVAPSITERLAYGGGTAVRKDSVTAPSRMQSAINTIMVALECGSNEAVEKLFDIFDQSGDDTQTVLLTINAIVAGIAMDKWRDALISAFPTVNFDLKAK